MKKGARILEHLRRLDELANQLTAIGEEVKEIHKVAVLLWSVQDHYSTLVTALLARGDEVLTMTFVKQSLLDEEQRHEKGSYSESGSWELKEDFVSRAGRGKFHRRPGATTSVARAGTLREPVIPNQNRGISLTEQDIVQRRLRKPMRKPNQMERVRTYAWCLWG